jgi:hypothetical protein
MIGYIAGGGQQVGLISDIEPGRINGADTLHVLGLER